MNRYSISPDFNHTAHDDAARHGYCANLLVNIMEDHLALADQQLWSPA